MEQKQVGRVPLHGLCDGQKINDGEHTHTHTCTHTHTHTHTCTHTHAHTDTHTHMHTHKHTHKTHTFTYTHRHAHTFYACTMCTGRAALNAIGAATGTNLHLMAGGVMTQLLAWLRYRCDNSPEYTTKTNGEASYKMTLVIEQ